jgi:putative tryptophan/tyrosine transport system substrate-binding protein
LTTRRRFLALGALAAMAAQVRAQAPRAKIGVLDPSPFEDSVYANSVVQAFTERGYAEGARATFLYRFAEGGFDQHREQARGLAAQNCDLLVALRSEPTARALQSVRPGAPILFLAIDYHPLESGVVTSLRSPDRNTTGVFVPQNALVARRIEILRQLIPQAKRLMVFADPYSADQVEAARKAAAAANFQLLLVQFGRQPYEYSTYLQDTRSVEADAFMNLASPIFTRDRRQIRDALSRLRLPSIGSNALQAEAGYLVSLGSNTPKVAQRLADIGVRLLAGTRASAIAVEQVEDFELVINNATARELGVKIPDSVRARTVRSIE